MRTSRGIGLPRRSAQAGVTAAAAVYTVALLMAGALLVHALSHALAGGLHGHAHELHEYLPPLAPSVIVFLVLALVGTLVGRAIAARTGRALGGGSFGAVWLRCVLGLLSVYFLQETTEAIVSGGQLTPADLIAGANSFSLLVAPVVALCVSLLHHGATRAIEAAAAGSRCRLLPRAAPPLWVVASSDYVQLGAVARLLAARGPPAAAF